MEACCAFYLVGHMKKIIAALLLAPAICAADEWTGKDKGLHFGVSYVLGIATGSQWPDNKLKAIGVAMIPGVLKEVADRKTTGFSGKDLVADLAGATLGVYTAHWLITRSNGTTTLAYTTAF